MAETNRFVERIAKTDNDAVITAYEKKIEELTNKKLLLEERLVTPDLYGGVSFETALNEVLGYIKNPYEIWSSGIFEDKRLVLRMVFAEQLVYNRKTGFETASFSLPITLFQLSVTEKSHLVDSLYLSWNTLENEVLRWNKAIPILEPLFKRLSFAQ